MKRREFLINSAITVAGLSLLIGTGEAKEVTGKKGIKKMKKSITLNYENIMPFINGNDIDNIIPKVKEARKILVEKSGAGKDYLGWLDLPVTMSQDLIKDIEETGKRIREISDVLISIGIGGSYLGARAAISAVNGTYANELALLNSNGLAICYSGCDMSTSHLRSLLDLIKNKRVFVNVISKSGTTTEPAIALRVIYEALKEAVGEVTEFSYNLEFKQLGDVTKSKNAQLGNQNKNEEETDHFIVSAIDSIVNYLSSCWSHNTSVL